MELEQTIVFQNFWEKIDFPKKLKKIVQISLEKLYS